VAGVSNFISGVAIGGTAPETNSFSTAGLTVGQHTLWVKADFWNDAANMANSGNNDVVESNETNNWLSFNFNVTAPTTPSLKIVEDRKSVVKGNGTQRATYGFSQVNQNNGAAAAGSSWEGAYLDGQ